MFNANELFLNRGARKGSTNFVPAIERFEPRITMDAAPVAADFSAAKNNVGLNSIRVDGVNLLRGSGFHIIGSRGTADDLFNVASESPYNSNGVMRAYNGNVAGGTVPYSLKFTRNADASKLTFDVSVGKPSTNFQVMNIPLEANLSHFSYWRTSDSPSLKRYDQNRLSYSKPEGNYYIEGGSGSWGEIVGPQYTIRVTINRSSSPMGLAFVNAPQLGGGIRDVEFGFNGLNTNQTKTASGTIQVFRTDPASLPTKVFQSESNAFHLIGTREGDGWRSKASERGFLQFGPNLKVDKIEGVSTQSGNLTAGKHTATFALQIDNNSMNNDLVATIEVYDSVSGRFLKSANITRKSFSRANVYQPFGLDFEASPGQALEFRVFSHGKASLKIDAVSVR